MRFNIGDVVRLKSGGPRMTVFGLTDRGYIIAVWFDACEELYDSDFEPEMLEYAAEVDDVDGFYDEDEEEDLADASAYIEWFNKHGRRGH